MKEITIDGVVYTPKSSAIEKDRLTYCVVRTYSAGVWAGWIDRSNTSKERTVYEARRLWRWWAEFTLSSLAIKGIREDKRKENMFAVPVPEVDLTEIIEVIPCTKEAMESILSVKNYNE